MTCFAAQPTGFWRRFPGSSCASPCCHGSGLSRSPKHDFGLARPWRFRARITCFGARNWPPPRNNDNANCMELADREHGPTRLSATPRYCHAGFGLISTRHTPHGETVPDSPSVPDHRPSTISMPWRIRANSFGGSRPARSVRKVRSRAMLCEALATESLGRPAVLAEINVFPGASAQTRLLVNSTQTIVAIRLRFSGLP